MRQARAAHRARRQRHRAGWIGIGHGRPATATCAFPAPGSEFALEAGSAGQRIGYRLRDNAIEILYWPYPDVSPAATPMAYVLASGITRFQLDYLDPVGGGASSGRCRAIRRCRAPCACSSRS